MQSSSKQTEATAPPPLDMNARMRTAHRGQFALLVSTEEPGPVRVRDFVALVATAAVPPPPDMNAYIRKLMAGGR